VARADWQLGQAVPRVHRPALPCGVSFRDAVERGVVQDDRSASAGVAVYAARAPRHLTTVCIHPGLTRFD
jgi:hypothetical protein